MSEQCEGTLTGRRIARFAPFVFAISIARATAKTLPAITTCPGELKLTASTTSFSRASLHVSMTSESGIRRL